MRLNSKLHRLHITNSMRLLRHRLHSFSRLQDLQHGVSGSGLSLMSKFYFFELLYLLLGLHKIHRFGIGVI